jgi:ATP-dependent protease ClpP protease subunit
MGAILAVSGDSIKMYPGSYLMFHNYSGGDHGKGREKLMAASEFDEHFKFTMSSICYPFLSKVELANLFKDQDLYVRSTDKCLIERVKRHFKTQQKVGVKDVILSGRS